MDRSDALRFLEKNQPMPADEDWTEESPGLDEVRRFFLEHPDPACIPLFLNVFGAGSGYGVYQRIEDVIRLFPKEIVLPHLKEALRTGTRSVRYWNTQLAAVFPDPSLVPLLATSTLQADKDLLDAAIVALGEVRDEGVRPVLLDLLKNQDLDAETRDLIRYALG